MIDHSGRAFALHRRIHVPSERRQRQNPHTRPARLVRRRDGRQAPDLREVDPVTQDIGNNTFHNQNCDCVRCNPELKREADPHVTSPDHCEARQLVRHGASQAPRCPERREVLPCGVARRPARWRGYGRPSGVQNARQWHDGRSDSGRNRRHAERLLVSLRGGEAGIPSDGLPQSVDVYAH